MLLRGETGLVPLPVSLLCEPPSLQNSSVGSTPDSVACGKLTATCLPEDTVR